MPESIDGILGLSVFISCDTSIDEFHDVLSRCLNITFARQEDSRGIRWSSRIMDLEIVWYKEHELENDSGINFVDYQFQVQIISLRTSLPMVLQDEIRMRVAQFIYEKMTHLLSAKGMLVQNLQKTLQEK